MADSKLTKLYFETYLAMIHGSVGSNMFQHLMVRPDEGENYDVLSDGNLSCAFYVGSVLKIFYKIKQLHATVDRTVQDMLESDWHETKQPNPGDVIIWAAVNYGGAFHKHIGFYIGSNRAISTSWQAKTPVEHDIYFGGDKRPIEKYLTTDWHGVR